MRGRYAIDWVSSNVKTDKAGFVNCSYREQFDKFFSLALYLVYRLGNRIPVYLDFPDRWREVHSKKELYKIGGKGYVDIVQRLIDAGIIGKTKNYCVGTIIDPYCKRYWLEDRWQNMFDHIKEGKIPCRLVEFPEKAFKVLSMSLGQFDTDFKGIKKVKEKKDIVNFTVNGCKSDSEILAKLFEYQDTCERLAKKMPAIENEEIAVHKLSNPSINDWKDLTVDDESLCKLIGLTGKHQKNDPCFIVLKHKFVNELMRDPSFKKNRFYHFFHRLRKEWRKCLRMNGEEIFEIFDIAGCDTKAVAKLAEKEADTLEKRNQLRDFQNDVISDYVRKFAGINKRTGKCFARIKLAWKIYLFGDYDRSWFDNLSKRNSRNSLRKIDELMKEKYPFVRDYIIEHKDIWYDMMGLETECISKGVCKDLLNIGIPSVTCHDAVYIKKSDGEKLKEREISVEELFYQHLNLKYIENKQASKEIKIYG